MLKKCILLAALAGLLGGCQGNDPELDARLIRQVPPNYRVHVANALKTYLKDPYSVRSAEISQPTTIFVGLVNGGKAPGVCVRMNAKNAFGAYVGIRTTAFVFKDGVVAGASDPLFDTCQNVAWMPFPEAEMH